MMNGQFKRSQLVRRLNEIRQSFGRGHFRWKALDDLQSGGHQLRWRVNPIPSPMAFCQATKWLEIFPWTSLCLFSSYRTTWSHRKPKGASVCGAVVRKTHPCHHPTSQQMSMSRHLERNQTLSFRCCLCRNAVSAGMKRWSWKKFMSCSGSSETYLQVNVHLEKPQHFSTKTN